MRARRLVPLALVTLTSLLLGAECPLLSRTAEDGSVPVPGLLEPVKVIVDELGVPHIFAQNDDDLLRVQGYVHARDRFWQMDNTRRQIDGTRSELLGPSVLDDDIQFRVIGLARAAVRNLDVLSDREIALLESYAAGVNAWIARVQAGLEPLPPEYVELELSETSLRPWSAVDTLALGKGLAANLSLDIDAGREEMLADACAAGDAATPPFDGAKLLFEDVQRFAPMDPSSTILDATGRLPFRDGPRSEIRCADAAPLVAQARRFRERLEGTSLYAAVLDHRESITGSNEWGVAAREAKTRAPLIANDPHLALDWPVIFYENHLIVANDPVQGPVNVSGVSFPGAPTVILGQNQHVAWGATTNPMDVTDLFRDRMFRNRPDCAAGSKLCVESGGELWPVKIEAAAYFLNTPGDGELDNLEQAPLGLTDPGALLLTVDHPMRSFGPIVDVEDFGIFFGQTNETNVLVLQFTGFHATRELQAFAAWNRARNLDDFRRGLQFFDFGSQNWAYADVDGNLAYFSSAENPLRRDLEAGHVAGLPPFFVRDGFSGENNWIPDPLHSQGQSIPFAVVPAAEMPQTVNPPRGFFANANNDPAGTTLDNDPLNQRRIGNPAAIYYLNANYDEGLRSGRITRLVRNAVESGRVSEAQMRAFQANTQQLDAELMLPFLTRAWKAARHPRSAPALAAFASDARLREAMERFARWDFSTPTGVPEGWDAGSAPEGTAPVGGDARGKGKGKGKDHGAGDREADPSVAATIYNVWRAKLLRSVIDARLRALGAPTVGSGDALKAVHHLLSERPFDGIGASGVDFFPLPAGLTAGERRDHALLAALRDALDALASAEFAAAFAHSTDQDDYRWGRLHRITFDHALGGSFSVPPAAGFEDLAPGLPGLARDGGYEVVNASSFSAWAGAGPVGAGPQDRSNEFRFGGGPVRRYVGAGLGAGVRGTNVIPGGASGVPGSSSFSSQLADWLVAGSHPVAMREREIARDRLEWFVPAP